MKQDSGREPVRHALLALVSELDGLADEVNQVLESPRWRLSGQSRTDLVSIHDRLVDVAVALRKEFDRPELDVETTKHHIGIAKRAIQMLRSPALVSALVVGTASGLATGVMTPPGTALANMVMNRAASAESRVNECEIEIETLILNEPWPGDVENHPLEDPATPSNLANPTDQVDDQPSETSNGDDQEIVDRRGSTPKLFALRDLLPLTLDQIGSASGRGGISGRPTGFRDLDLVLSGLRPRNLYVLAARPGMGATSFSLNVAANLAFHDRVPTVLVSLDLTEQDASSRLISAEALVRHSDLRAGRLEEGAWARVSHAVGRLAEAPIYVYSSGRPSVRGRTEVLDSVRETEGLVGSLIVDGLQLGGHDAGELRLTLAALRQFANDYETPVLVTTRLGRSVDERIDRRPMLIDLDESVETAADVVIGLYRDEVYEPDTPNRGIAEFFVLKDRNGGTARVVLAFRAMYSRFDNLAKPERFHEPVFEQYEF